MLILPRRATRCCARPTPVSVASPFPSCTSSMSIRRCSPHTSHCWPVNPCGSMPQVRPRFPPAPAPSCGARRVPWDNLPAASRWHARRCRPERGRTYRLAPQPCDAARGDAGLLLRRPAEAAWRARRYIGVGPGESSIAHLTPRLPHCGQPHGDADIAAPLTAPRRGTARVGCERHCEPRAAQHRASRPTSPVQVARTACRAAGFSRGRSPQSAPAPQHQRPVPPAVAAHRHHYIRRGCLRASHLARGARSAATTPVRWLSAHDCACARTRNPSSRQCTWPALRS